MFNKEYLKEISAQYEIGLSEEALEKFSVYSDFLREYNEKVNLTAITDENEIAVKHFLDSMLLLKVLNKKDISIADVGAGAGFPSVPFLIANNKASLYAIEPNNKRVEFLNQLSEKIKLPFEARHIRAEEAGRNAEYRENFDVVTARAVKEMRELSELCLPLVKVGGVFAALKGPDISEEIEGAKNAIRLLGGQLEEISEFTLPDGAKRNIVLVKKISHTSAKYPRMYAKIKKNPL
ncbi:MAG: 16S rRNA (guanine(527)-N(7))-methyltransferase RsmG [Oscillospiraceae bacterium]|nr:16S rRNA (guanine(527)-N(7))-methyltransferase RsmG [Oscillospiraceae bacterium]